MNPDDLGGSQESEGLGNGRHFDDDNEFDKSKIMKGLVNALNGENQESIVGVD